VTGIQAITANNGWAMAVTGALIVMAGLAILAFIISQLHKIIGLFEGHHKEIGKAPSSVQPIDSNADMLGDLDAIAKIYQALTADMGPKFKLLHLYQAVNKENLPHAHLTIRSLRDAGHLIPQGQGTFTWKHT
jgi:Na+-transporting methylmalonyl-CoA/oxaloacetate decarboxylase gamma subunit